MINYILREKQYLQKYIDLFMCYWVGTKKVREVLLNRHQQNPNDDIGQLFYRTFIDPPVPKNALQLMEHPVAIGKAKPIITTLIKEQGILQFKNMQWTLRWNYFDSKTKIEKPGRPLLNSRCENVFWQHNDLIFSKRCIIPIDGYWEYYHFKGETYPVFIYPEHRGLFYVGGIWNEQFDDKTGRVTETFSIITTPPNEITRKLHNNPDAHDGPRMLLLIDEKQGTEFLNENLKADDIKQLFFKPLEAEKMKYHSTVRFLKRENAALLTSDKVQEKFDYEELTKR